MKKVLVPVDFSDNSLNALRYGQQLLSHFEVIFYLFSTYTVQPSNLLGDEWGNEWEASISLGIDNDLKEIIEHFKQKNKNIGHHFRYLSQSGFLISTIKLLVKAIDVDFILMGTKGVKSIKSLFLGSNAVKVLNTISECPTIIVPDGFEPRVTKQIIFSTNYKSPFVKDELKPLLEFVKTLEAKLAIVHIMEERILTEKQKSHKDALIFLLNGIPHTFHKMTYEVSESKAIRDFIIEAQIDMVSFIYHKQKKFSKLLEENVVEKVSFNSPIPIMILPKSI